MGISDSGKKILFGGDYEPDGLCCIRGCAREIWGHEFCRQHYHAWHYNGHPLHILKRIKAPAKAASTKKEKGAWYSAINRCTNPNNQQFKNYGARGIMVCERWRASFDNFLSDLGRSPGREYSLERDDVNGNYEPGNCRWATMTEQNRNQRTTRLSVDIVAEAKRRHQHGEAVMAIAKELGVPNITLWQAIRGKSWKEVEAAVG